MITSIALLGRRSGSCHAESVQGLSFRPRKINCQRSMLAIPRLSVNRACVSSVWALRSISEESRVRWCKTSVRTRTRLRECSTNVDAYKVFHSNGCSSPIVDNVT